MVEIFLSNKSMNFSIPDNILFQFGDTFSKFGKLDILVNNAGVGAGNPVEDLTQDDWNWQMDIMAKGTFLGTKYAIREMLNAGAGSIVNVSSIFSIIGSRGDSIYSAAKGAIHSFT